MTKNLLYLTFIFVAVVALSNGATKCTEGENGFMYCEDMSSQGQSFLKNNQNGYPTALKKRAKPDVCLTSENDDIIGLLSGFDIFCFDEISAANSFSITGRVAAKNAINIGSVTINNSYPQDCTKHDFKYAIYTDKLTMGDGQIHGGIHYGSLLNIKGYQKEDLVRNNCAISKDSSDNLDFDAIEKKITDLSNEMNKIVSNAKVELHDAPNRRLVLSKDIKDYVIDVDDTTFANNKSGYNFSIENPDNIDPKDVTIIFNVKTKTFSLHNASYSMNGFESRIIWNMPEATSAEFYSASIYGLLLAPKAELNLENGNLYGKVISKQFTTKSVSISNTSFTGCIPNISVKYKDETVCNDVNVESKEINSDIVFVFDESKSMCPYIKKMRNKLQTLIDELNEAKANARFAVIGFGGKPRIYSPFTSNITEVKAAFKEHSNSF